MKAKELYWSEFIANKTFVTENLLSIENSEVSFNYLTKQLHYSIV